MNVIIAAQNRFPDSEKFDITYLIHLALAKSLGDLSSVQQVFPSNSLFSNKSK